MTVVEISESKLECLEECVEKILKSAGKIMTTLLGVNERGEHDYHGREYYEDEEEEYRHPKMRNRMSAYGRYNSVGYSR